MTTKAKTLSKTDPRAAAWLRDVDAALGSDAIGAKDVEIREGYGDALWAIERLAGVEFHYTLDPKGRVARHKFVDGEVVEGVFWKAGLRSKVFPTHF
jgi:hypothetical protein